MKQAVLLFVILLSVLKPTVSFSQETGWKHFIDSCVNTIHHGSSNTNAYKLKKHIESNSTEIINHIEVLINDSNYQVRIFAVNILGMMGNSAIDIKAKQKAALVLTELLIDKTYEVRYYVPMSLKKFSREDISEPTKSRMLDIVVQTPENYRDMFKLLGYFNDKTAAEKLRTVLLQGGLNKITRWEIQLALARMGDAEAIQFCLDIAKKIPVNTDYIYHLAPDLIYTRNKEIFNYLVEIIHSDKADCASSNPNVETKILCGYRIIEYMAPVIKEYPYKLHVSGDLDVDDYEKAMKNIRKFFKKKNGNYEINNNIF